MYQCLYILKCLLNQNSEVQLYLVNIIISVQLFMSYSLISSHLGYHFGDFFGDDHDSLSQSDDDSDGHREEDDDFADDEAMSHQDSSSQEYLDDTRYLDDEEDEVYCEPPPSFQEIDASHLSSKCCKIFRGWI